MQFSRGMLSQIIKLYSLAIHMPFVIAEFNQHDKNCYIILSFLLIFLTNIFIHNIEAKPNTLKTTSI